MKNWHISRRTFLRGTAGAALGLPFLEVMQPRSARAAAKSQPPIRMGCLYLPNGVPFDAWEPETKFGKLTALNKWMASLEPYREDFQFITGLQSETKGSHPGAGRDLACAAMSRRRSHFAGEKRRRRVDGSDRCKHGRR